MTPGLKKMATPTRSIARRTAFGVAAATLALLAPLPSAWGATPTFTVAKNIFPSTPLGQSITQNVTVTVNTAVAIQSIALGTGLAEYKLGTITGCSVDGTTVNAVGTVCTLPVTYTPIATGSTASPATARTAQLVVTDIESGSPVPYAFGLLGAATGPIAQFTPATLTRVAGAAATGYPADDQGLAATTNGYSGDGGPATSAQFAFLNIFSVFDEPNQPMAVDSSGNIYVIDLGNLLIRRIDGTTNTVTTVAGVPKTFGRTGDGGPGTSAEIEAPASLALDAADNVYFSDAGTASTDGGYTIRRVSAATGIINSIAGQNLVLPYAGTGSCVESGQSSSWEPTCGDGGLATDAFLYNPQAIAIDGAGDIFILEEQGTIRRIDAVTGIITSIGNAVPSGNGEGFGMAMGADGNLYAAVYDAGSGNEYLTQIDPSTGTPKTLGGGATTVSNTACKEQGSIFTDWSLGFNASFSAGLSADGAGNIYGDTGECNSVGQPGEGQFRFNIASGLASFYTSGTGGGNGTTNTVFESYGGAYGVEPAFAVPDSAGNVYFQTYNQIAKLNGSQGSLYGYGSRFDFQTDTAGITCATNGSYCQTAVIANLGNEPLDTSFALSSGFSYLTVGDTAACANGTLAPGDFCNLDIEFTPLTVGTINGSLTATDNAALQSAGQQILALNGVGVAQPEIAFSPATIAFGNVAVNGTSASQTVTISNSGTGTLTLENIFIDGSGVGNFTITGGTCPTSSSTLAVGDSCTVLVAFTPTSPGTFSAYLNVNNNGANSNGSLQATTFSGTATTAQPEAALSPTTLAFGGILSGSTSELSTTLSNSGSVALSITSISITGANTAGFAIVTGANACGTSLAAGASCQIYVTFTPTSTAAYSATLSVADNATPTPQTAALSGAGVSFISNVGAALAAQAVNVHITTAGTLGSIQVLTQGAANLDFTSATGGTCAANTAYTAGQSCTVSVIFKPRFAGARRGAVLLADGSGNVLGTTYLPGTGIGPQIVFGPGTKTILPAPSSGDGFQAPLGIAVDLANNVFVSDSVNNRIVKLPWTGSGYGTPILVPTTGLNDPGGIAIDGGGNIWIADTLNSRIVEVPWNGSAYGTQTTLTAPVSEPEGVAVDGSGNIFIADTEHNRLVELPWNGSGYGTPVTNLVTGVHFPKGVAVDANGDVYVADTGDGQILELPWNGTAFGAQVTLTTSNLFQPFSMAIGVGGSLYIADSDAGLIVELPWNGTAFGTQITVPIYGLGNAAGVSVDGSGNVYVADAGNNDAVKLDVADAPSLSFASTNVGSTSTDSPKTVPVTNIGNAALTFSSGSNPAYPLNFPVNSADNSLCASGSPLAESASCDVSVKFAPTTSGALTGNVVLTDNDLNASGATQSIAVSGTGLQALTAATPVISPASGTFNSSVSVSITDSTAGATIYYTTDGTTPTVNSTKYTAPFTISTTGTSVRAIAAASGYANSAVALATYTLQAITPVFTPPAGTYIGSQSVAITSATPGAAIYYTTNGIAPTTESTLYTAPVPISVTGTNLQAIATLSGYTNSAVASGTYTIQAPAVTLSPSALNFNSQNEGTTSAALMATLKNSGTAPLTITAITLGGSAPGSFSESDTCVTASPLAANATCTISVKFSPTTTGTFTASVSIADNAAGSPQAIALSGTGAYVAPQVTLLPATLNFGNVAEGTSSTAQTVTLTNIGTSLFTISSTSFTGSGLADFSLASAGTTCGATLAPGAKCVFSLFFSPAAVNTYSASFNVTDSPDELSSSVSVTGTGIVPPAPIASLTPSSLTFSSTTGTTTAAQTATLSNTGNAALAISGISITGTDPSDFAQTNTCGTSLAAGSSCTISVTFTPASATSLSATLSVADNAAGSPQTTALSGTATPPIGDFNVSSPTAPQTVKAGSAATYSIVVATTPSGDIYSNPVTLTVSGLPTGATASFSPASVTPGTGSATSTLTIQTATPVNSAAKATNSPWPLAMPSLAFLCGGFSLLFFRKRHSLALRRFSTLLILTALGLGSLAVMGCGGGFALPNQAKTYTVTVTGTAGSDTHSTTVTLTVN